MHVLLVTGQELLDVGLQYAVFTGVVSHKGLPVLTFDGATGVRAHERPAGRKGGLYALVEMPTT